MEEESKKIMKMPGMFKRLIFTGQLTRLIIYLAAAIPAIIFIFLALFASFGVIKPATFGTVIIGTAADFLLIGLFIFTGVFGIYEFLRLHRVHKIDNRFPDFVRDLAESRRAGMTFTKAIMYSSRGNYGVLTSEIQKIARQISWGSSVDNALNAFAKRVNTKLIRRTISLIIEASRSGGNVADVLEAASRDAREIKLIESERRASMLSYIAVIYVAMGVFLLILVVLCKSLVPSMLGSGAADLQGTVGGGGGNIMGQGDVLMLFFCAALVQSGMMGIVTGVFEEGNVISGVKHTFIMLIIVWIIFKFIVTGV